MPWAWHKKTAAVTTWDFFHKSFPRKKHLQGQFELIPNKKNEMDFYIRGNRMKEIKWMVKIYL